MSRAAFVLATALVLVATRANAEGPKGATARLSYSRGSLVECPDEDSLRNSVTARLGYDPFRPDGEKLVSATIARDGGVLRGTLGIRDPARNQSGARMLTSATNDCDELAGAMALAMSVAIDPLSLTRPREGSPSAPAAPAPPPPPPAPLPAVDRLSSPPPPNVGPPPEPVAIRAGAAFFVAFGTTPGTSLAPGIFGGIGYKRLSLDIEARAHLPTEATADNGTVRASLLLVTLAPCIHEGVLVGCVLAGLGSLHGEGTGVDLPERDASLYASVAARIGLEAPLSHRIFLRAGAEGIVPLLSTTLKLRGSAVWSTPTLAAALGGGIGGQF